MTEINRLPKQRILEKKGDGLISSSRHDIKQKCIIRILVIFIICLHKRIKSTQIGSKTDIRNRDGLVIFNCTQICHRILKECESKKFS